MSVGANQASECRHYLITLSVLSVPPGLSSSLCESQWHSHMALPNFFLDIKAGHGRARLESQDSVGRDKKMAVGLNLSSLQ